MNRIFWSHLTWHPPTPFFQSIGDFRENSVSPTFSTSEWSRSINRAREIRYLRFTTSSLNLNNPYLQLHLQFAREEFNDEIALKGPNQPKSDTFFLLESDVFIKGATSRYFELFWLSTKLPLNWKKPENNTL